MTVCTVLGQLWASAVAAELSVTVQAADGRGITGVVVVAEPVQPAAVVRSISKASIDQRELQFVPGILVIRTGTAIDFPNSDQVRHQVYSFSPAKTFQLSLYAGRAHPPVVFDRPGLVTLGCNIHDGMLGYVYVTDSPWFGRTDGTGSFRFSNLPAGDYVVRVWHPRFKEVGPQLSQRATVAESQDSTIEFRLQRALRPGLRNVGTEKQWEDY